jgi:hypothetical protein
MKLYEEFKLYENMWNDSQSFNEEWVLENSEYKVGDLVVYKDSRWNDKQGKSKDVERHGVILDIPAPLSTSATNIIGIWKLDDYGVTDTSVRNILNKISENDLTEEEKSNYKKYGKPFSEKRIKELSKDTASDMASQEESEKSNTEPKNAKLNKARQANKKIIQAFKEVGLPTDDLTVVAINKKGKEYKKASDKLKKFRKILFGESLEDDSAEIEK